MKAADHARVWERAFQELKDSSDKANDIDAGDQISRAIVAAALKVMSLGVRTIARAYREEAERNPE